MKNIENKPAFNQKLNEIYRDILGIEVKSTDSFKSLTNKFYEVMRKWGIKQGTWSEDGSICICNAEWNMCFQIFKQHKIISFDVWECLKTPPKDLLAYGKKPKKSKI